MALGLGTPLLSSSIYIFHSRTLEKPSPFPSGTSTADTDARLCLNIFPPPAHRAQRIYEPSSGQGQRRWHSKAWRHRKKYASTADKFRCRQPNVRECSGVKPGRSCASSPNSPAKLLFRFLLKSLFPLQLSFPQKIQTAVASFFVKVFASVFPRTQQLLRKGQPANKRGVTGGAGRAGKSVFTNQDFYHGSWPGPRDGSRGFKKIEGRVGPGQKIFEMSRFGSGRVGSGRVGSGRVGSGRVGSGRVGSGRVESGAGNQMSRAGSVRPDPTRPARSNPTREISLAGIYARYR